MRLVIILALQLLGNGVEGFAGFITGKSGLGFFLGLGKKRGLFFIGRLAVGGVGEYDEFDVGALIGGGVGVIRSLNIGVAVGQRIQIGVAVSLRQGDQPDVALKDLGRHRAAENGSEVLRAGVALERGIGINIGIVACKCGFLRFRSIKVFRLGLLGKSGYLIYRGKRLLSKIVEPGAVDDRAILLAQIL